MQVETSRLPDAGALTLFPLSTAQTGVWFAQMLDTDSPCYNIGMYVEIFGSVDPGVFERALREAVAGADALHLHFIETENGPRQYFGVDAEWVMPFIDVSSEANPRTAAEAWMRDDLAGIFDLSCGPLFRFALFQAADDRFFWYGVFHHLINDAAGSSLIVRRVADLYSSFVENAIRETEEPCSWLDLLDEEESYRLSARRERDQNYWRAQLVNRPDSVTLSGCPPSSPGRIFQSAGYIPRSIVNELEKLGAAHGTSLAAVIAATTAIYLYKITGARDLILGMPVAARTSAKLRRIVGLVANVVPLRLSIGPAESAGDLVRHAGQCVREALRHQRYWAGALRQDLGLNANEPDVYGTGINFIPLGDGFDFAGRPVRKHSLGNWRVEDLLIAVYAGNQEYGVRVEFIANAALYDAPALDQHRQRFLHLLDAMVAAPGRAIGQLDILTPDERHTILSTWNDTAGSIPLATLPELVEDQVARTPNATALVFEETSLTYAELNQRPPQTPTEEALCEIWRDTLRAEEIGRFDDFFDRGGHSLMAIQVMSRVRDVFQLEFPLKTLFEARTLEALARQIDISLRERRHAPNMPLIEVMSSDGPAPLSLSQERMWLIQSLDPKNTAYNIAVALRLRGALDIKALSDALNELKRRHEILRSTIRLVNDQPVQDIAPFANQELTVVDLRNRGNEAWTEALRLAEIEVRIPFDLAHGPVIRAALFQIDRDDHLFTVTLHHIAGDQWSFGILGRELAAVYNDLRKGLPARLKPLPISYRDYASWQRRWLQGTEFEKQMSFWRHQLANLPPLELPTDRPRPRFQSLNGAFCQAAIPAPLILDLELLGHREGGTLFMTMFSAFATLLHRITGQEDIPIGVPVANRTQSAVEELVGAFVNTLVLRADLSGNPEFRLLLHRVRATALDAFAHQDVSFDKLVQELGQLRDTSRAPLTQVLFNVLNAPMRGIEFDEFDWEPVLLDRGGAQFELSLSIDTQVNRSLIIEYNTDLFDRATIERLIGQYFTILESVAADPGARLRRLPLLPVEQLSMLRDWNATSAFCPQDKIFVRMFEEQVAKCPGAPAVLFEGATIDYAEINAQANAVAHKLRDHGVGPGDLVGLCVNRSFALVIALLGIQKSGGAYVPLDPDFPAERLGYMLSDSGAKVLVTAGNDADALDVPDGVRILDLTTKTSFNEAISTANLDGGATPQDIAYVIYTSGSTGRPKGVAVPHKALMNFLWSMRREPGLTGTDVLAAVTTISFDIAALELYLPLMVGARIELVSRETAADGKALSQLLSSSGTSVLQATPATWRMLLESGWSGCKGFRALSGGEALSRDLADALLNCVDELWNLYGPTETTIWSTADRVDRGGAPISIGRPISNTQVHVLDRAGEPLPIGIAGEICIGGAGVAMGYYQRPALTAEHFIPDRGLAQSGARLYRTGDLGRWGADGKLYHVGRMDHQIKIRGFRIELGEIETVLRAHPAVRQSVVLAREAQPGDQRLVAYVVYQNGEDLTVSELRRYLRRQLPEFMIPSVFVALESVPLTPNGKVDRSSLPDPFRNALRAVASHEPPAPGMEQLMAEIWQDILKVDRISAEDNFFELGGHSLLALRVAAAVKKRIGYQMDPRALFFQNLRQAAALLRCDAAATGTYNR